MALWNIGKAVQRIIVVVDIRDLKYIRRLIDTKPYLAAIRDCVHKILAFTSSNQYPDENDLSSSVTVWAFKFFDSSMSPYRSRSVIEKTVGKWAGHVRFESTTQTEAFVSALKHLANAKPNSQPRNSDFFHGGRLDFIALSMQELINDYIWDPLVIKDAISPHSIDNNHSNLVVLFSSFPWTRNGFDDFLMEEIPVTGNSVKIPSSSDEDLLSKFSLKLNSLRESFRAKDIHFCWIDIPPIFPAHDIIECEISRERVMETFKAMQWSFVSLDTLLVASISVPFHLIWPTIAYSSSMLMFTNNQCKKIPGDLSMEVEGIDGRSVKGRICKVQCIAYNLDLIEDSSTCNQIAGLDFSAFISKNKADHKRLLMNWDNVKIHIAEVFKKEKCPNLSCVVSEHILLRGLISAKAGNEDEDMDGIGDAILERLQQEKGEFCQGKPAWQLILGFLSSKKCMALVTVSDGRRGCLPLSAVLEPFTVHVGMLYILDPTAELRITRTSLFTEATGDFSPEKTDHIDDVQVSQEISGLTNAQKHGRTDVGPGKYKNQSALCKRKRTITSHVSSKRLKSSEVSALTPSKSDLQLIKYNTWEALYTTIVCRLCKAEPCKATVDPTIKMEARYKKAKGTQSKILRFLICWFDKNSKQLDVDHNVQLKVSQLKEEAAAVLEKTTIKSEPSGEGSNSIPKGALPTDAASAESVDLSGSENVETLIVGSLDEKIQYVLCHEGIDLGTIAKRLVQQLISNLEPQSMEKNSDSSDIENLSISEQIIPIFLKEPKELVAKYNECLLPRSSSAYTSEDKVREHELQILFRMEMLSVPNIAGGLDEDMKENCIEDICLLLENIQFNLSGAVEGQSLIEFADRVIKSRYTECVPEIIDRIYERMDFLEPDPSTSSVIELMATNSSDQENILLRLTKKRREKKERDGGDEYEKKLRRAQLKRERSKRFSHFASRAPDLQRVWAPKTPAFPKKLPSQNQSQKVKAAEVKNPFKPGTQDKIKTPSKIRDFLGKFEATEVKNPFKPGTQDEIKTTSKIRDFLGGEPRRRTIEFNISESEDENDEDKVETKCESPKKTSIFRNFMVNGGGGKADNDGLTSLRERIQRAS